METVQHNIKVSIILPSLNVASYIRECMESVMNQTLQEIEIICVDAGSTDGTLEILQEYEKQDDRIKLIKSDKKSYGYQMNLGMQTAVGEYIGIVETDDYVPTNMYEELYTAAKENDVDFVKADFYRFTGNGNTLKIIKRKLTDNKSYYGRIINIEKEPECLFLNMVTWSGIYSREFIERNNIVYNETPGASYQDNGFWFQTFIYAQRALFIDKAYYMLRRDNPASSIYNAKKVYCVCDEFRFILNILLKDSAKFEIFKYYYAFQCYETYKWNLEKIDDEHKQDFLVRFAQDFQEFQQLKMLKSDLYSKKDWDILTDIIEDPIKFYEDNIALLNRLLDEISSYKYIIIYGAGLVGRQMLKKLERRGKRESILCFAVSRLEENPVEQEGLAVREIKDLTGYGEEGVIVIATTMKYHAEMTKLAKQFGFRHIITIPETTL